MNADDRHVPHDLSAERSLLGAVLVENDLFGVAGLPAEFFFREAHKRIWRAYGRLDAARQAIDVVTLSDALRASGDLDEVGGLGYLAGLGDGVPREVNVEGYARIVRGMAARRDLISAARAIESDAYDAADVDELVDRSESRLMNIGRQAARGDFLLASDWMAEMYGAVDKANSEKRAVNGVPCGLASIDNLTRGWQPSDLIVIAGRPSDGKTSIALQFALEASRHVFVAFCSLEMSRVSVGFRAVALEARVDAFRMMTGQLKDHEMRRVGDALSRLSERRLAIDDAAGQSVAGLCAKVRRLTSRYGAGVVFVDYLQLLHGASAENRTQEITQISGRLKALAKELNVPVVALSQLTRENQRGPAPTRPQLHNLRDGGSIEQDADVVLMIHRPNRSTESAKFVDGEIAELIVAKQRNGPAGKTIETVWHAQSMRFADKAPETEQGSLPA